MTPEQFRVARNILRLTQADLAALLDVTPQTIRKYERTGPSVMAQAAIWALSQGWRP